MYDVKCEQLARDFLEDDNISDPEVIAKLAQHIQDEIEGWIAYEKSEARKQEHSNNGDPDS